MTSDATNLEPGDYGAELCLASNDPQMAVFVTRTFGLTLYGP